MYRWAWLERRLRNHPMLNFTLLLGGVIGCGVIALTTGDEPSPRSGIEMRWIGLAGVLVFGYASIMAIRKIRRRND